jgi:hypothetical protein
MSWKPEVFVEGKWSRNGLVFATREEAEANAKDLMWRWFLVRDSRAVEVEDRVNYTYHEGVLKSLEEEAQ